MEEGQRKVLLVLNDAARGPKGEVKVRKNREEAWELPGRRGMMTRKGEMVGAVSEGYCGVFSHGFSCLRLTDWRGEHAAGTQQEACGRKQGDGTESHKTRVHSLTGDETGCFGNPCGQTRNLWRTRKLHGSADGGIRWYSLGSWRRGRRLSAGAAWNTGGKS